MRTIHLVHCSVTVWKDGRRSERVTVTGEDDCGLFVDGFDFYTTPLVERELPELARIQAAPAPQRIGNRRKPPARKGPPGRARW